MRDRVPAGRVGRSQFFLFPADPRGNNAKVYVIRDAATEVWFA